MADGDARDDTGEQTVAALITDAIEASELSLREIARRFAGADAPEKDRENVRRQIIRWKAGRNAPEPANARKLAVVLNRPLDAFVSDRKSKARTLGEISDAAEKIQLALKTVEAQLRRQGLEPPRRVVRASEVDVATIARLEALEGEVAALRRNVRDLAREVRQGFAAVQQLLGAQQPASEAPGARPRASSR